MERLELDGGTLAFERAGSGPPLLLLHGGLSDRREWRRQLTSLADAFTVVAWDAPGCGGSSDPMPELGMEGYADCAAALLDRLGLGAAHVAGLSFGGTLALELARRHPRLVRSIVLVSAYAGWAGSLPPDVVAERLDRALRDAERPPAQVADEFVPELLVPGGPPELAAELHELVSGFRPEGARAMARAMAAADLRDALPLIDVPVLLLYGEEDRRAPPALAEELAARIPRARLVLIPGAGHQLNLEAPERFDAEVRGFLPGGEG